MKKLIITPKVLKNELEKRQSEPQPHQQLLTSGVCLILEQFAGAKLVKFNFSGKFVEGISLWPRETMVSTPQL